MGNRPPPSYLVARTRPLATVRCHLVVTGDTFSAPFGNTSRPPGMHNGVWRRMWLATERPSAPLTDKDLQAL